MAKNEDRRIRMTKKILKEALIEMMRTKPIYEISIKKVCEAADINRSTFYHHYHSPQDVYDDIINDIAADITVILNKFKDKSADSEAMLCELLCYAEENRDLFLVILSTNGNIGIGEKLTNIISSFLGADVESELSAYCSQFVSAGVANILWLWLNNKDRLPPDDVAALLTAIMTRGVRQAVNFSAKESYFNV